MHSLANPDSGAYIQQLLITYEEPLNLDGWRAAWIQLVERHEVLRTVFELGNVGGPLQKVQPLVATTLSEHDWRNDSLAVNEQRLEAFLNNDRRSGFDLAKLPLWRWNLFRFALNDVRLVWTSHHALFDGRSRLLLMRELFAGYDAVCRKNSTTWENGHSFAEFVRWQAHKDDEQNRNYWQNLLEGFSQRTALPERNHQLSLPMEASSHLTITRRWTANRTADLQHFAACHGVTVNTLLQGSWALLIGRYSGSNDVVFGATRACRRSPVTGVETMVGLLINTLPVRVRMPANALVHDWLQELRGQWIAGRDHEHTSLLKVQQWSELPPGEPLFESLVVCEKFCLEAALWQTNPAWRTRLVRLLGTTPYPLVLAGYFGEECSLEITFDRRRFDAETIERMAGHLEALLDGMLADPYGKLRNVPMLSERERNQILVEWNHTSTDYPKDKCIHQIFEEQVARSPDAVAVVCGSQSLTYRELSQRANHLALHLRSLGVGANVLVGVSLDRSFEMIIALLGILKSGGAYWGLEENLPEERFKQALADAQPRVLLGNRKSFNHLRQFLGKSATDSSFCISAILAIEDWLPLNPIEIAQPLLDTPSDHASHPAYVSYTSGSTGRPKGVLVPHRGVVRLVKNSNYATLDAQETLLHLSPLSFDASTFEIWGALLNGGRLVLLPSGPLELAAIGTTIREQGVTTAWLTAGLFRLMVDERLEDLKSLRQLLAGGDVLPPEHVRKACHALPGCRIINGYGPTENTTFTCCYPVVAGQGFASSVPIGKPIANTKVYVLDAHHQPVPIGVAGELYAGGDGVACGYLRQPQLTAECFLRDPFSTRPEARLYRTGDRARWRADGNLEFLGRCDNQVKIRGFRIELGEVESALRLHPAIHEVCVLAKEGMGGDKQLLAYLIAQTEEKPDKSQLRTYLAPKLPDYMLPQTFVWLDQLPLTPNGKVDRRTLAGMAGKELGSEVTVLNPRTDLERQLVTIWQEVLGVPKVGITDDFFELGGHSLLAMQAVFRMRQQLDSELLVADLFRYRTVAQLSDKLSAIGVTQGNQRTGGPVPVSRAGGAPLLSSQHAFWRFAAHYSEVNPYNTSRAYRLKGHLDTDALQQALTLLVERHEALRTKIHEVAGEPRQFVSPSEPVVLPLVDLSQLGIYEQESEIQRLYQAESFYQYKFSRDLMLRATLIRLNEIEYVLVLIVAHIVMDGASVEILNRDLAEFYGAVIERRSPFLPTIPVQPFDIAFWEQEQFKSGRLQRSITFWRQHLQGLFPGNQPLGSESLIEVPNILAFRHQMALSGELVEALKFIACEGQCTLPTTLFAAVNVFHRVLTGRVDCAISSPLAARIRPEMEDVISCLRVQAVLLTWVTDDLSFRKILQSSHEVLIGAYSHLDASLELVFSGNHFKHFSDWPGAFFNFNFIPQAGFGFILPGLETTPIMRPEEVTNFPFSLHVLQRAQTIQLVIKGRADLFSESAVRETLERFVELLGRLAANPDAPLSAEWYKMQGSQTILPA